jgi:outer membrane receptor protein involved in Fe transport
VKQDAYGLLDLRAGVEAKHWMLELWVKNLLNTDYASFYFEALGNKYAQAGRPMRFGTSLTVKL